MRDKDLLGKLLLLSLSLLISVFAAEAICRVFLDPVDYLLPEMVNDTLLGHRIAPASAGHDAWGFRNNTVPATAEVVTIGDSQTYGVSATAANSWPALLEGMLGKKVYNLALGGYGPVEYHYLLEHKAFQLNPSFIAIGFYFGNDLIDSYLAVYRRDYWEDLRIADYVAEEDTTLSLAQLPTRRFDHLRSWLANKSILYRIITHSAIGNLMRLLETQSAAQKTDQYTELEVSDHNIRTAFTPRRRFTSVDLNDHKVQEGIRISLDRFVEMHELCKKEGVPMVVVLIPTKESVFAKHVENNPALANANVFGRLIANERQINQLVKAFFEEHEVDYIDVLEPLADASTREQLYPSNIDGHPNKNGYRIIATEVQRRYERVLQANSDVAQALPSPN